tara:strand:- start:880 stop:1221 length:342 start_codon:yes stop_codon:yes gene_type:complete
MTLAREVNKKLDEMLLVQQQISELQEMASDAEFKNSKTGALVDKEIVINEGREQIAQITTDLNQITNDGKNIRNIFANPYYANDRLLDKLIAEEIKQNKMESCLAKQVDPNKN